MPITNYSPSKAIQVTEVIDMKYVDRGDPAEVDFTQADLTLDDAWHELDLSAIVPAAGANHLVHLKALATITIAFREVGNINTINVTPEATGMHADSWVMLDANRKIEYMTSAGMIGTLTVRGWWTD